jgi:hypothetical protein
MYVNGILRRDVLSLKTSLTPFYFNKVLVPSPKLIGHVYIVKGVSILSLIPTIVSWILELFRRYSIFFFIQLVRLNCKKKNILI